MKKEFMADVMNEIDDDLILEAAELRSKQGAQRKKWIFPAAMAASLAIIAGVLIGRYGFPLFAQNNESMGMESQDSYLSSSQEGLREEHSESENSQEIPVLLVTVERWTDDGFVGTVSQAVDTEAIPVGSRVSVKTDDNTEFLNMPVKLEDFNDMAVQADMNKEDPMVLYIMFHAADIESSVSNQADSEKTYYLYAEQVWPAESEIERRE